MSILFPGILEVRIPQVLAIPFHPGEPSGSPYSDKSSVSPLHCLYYKWLILSKGVLFCPKHLTDNADLMPLPQTNIKIWIPKNYGIFSSLCRLAKDS